MKKNRPINYTIQTRQATAAEEQSYLQIAETTSTEPEEQTATIILTATNSRESIPDSEEQITPTETSAEENNSTTTPGTPADEPLDTSAENNITEEESSEEENSENSSITMPIRKFLPCYPVHLKEVLVRGFKHCSLPATH